MGSMKYFTLVGILTVALAGSCRKEQNSSEKQELEDFKSQRPAKESVPQSQVGWPTGSLQSDCSSERVNFERISGK